MKHIIILGDGMADHPVERLGGKTLLQYADTPYMDLLARKGKTGRLMTIPDGFHPGSEVANTSILGYDLNKVYEGRGPLEAASIGYNMSPEDLALRCNLITLSDGIIKNHHGGHLTTEEGTTLIKYLNEKLGNEYIQFIPGIQYRHLLIIKGGSKHIICAPPHDHPNEAWRPLLIKAENENKEDGRLSPQETANLLNELIIKSQKLLTTHPFNLQRKDKQNDIANSIWPWGGGYRPQMRTLSEMFPQIHSGSVISAVDLIRGIGYYAGLEIIKVKGATGLANTNYEGKVEAALKQLREKDFVFLHIEASDEAGHDGDLQLKLQTIENLDHRAIEPIYNEVKKWDEPVCIAVLPDHPTPVEIRTHVKEPVPFLIWHPGITPDNVTQYDETSCVRGEYGLIYLQEFMHSLMEIK
ncbi:cofactor-independent phosphoglycerate mutase [Prevotella histicola]|jgi:2,3-bisphosphoglycerate-independent phosphoglycerate mutase|uniref:cofactor-independent phosphoglycerate mutase n=1 Tax=Prevotella histicola TaxID=470565 RepID=UPI001C603D63|nr:cofactor-independent phosphoglycerate mutase [Prevotella histicola]MBW4775669.1 cofactor-independent phosphoglycerate mutase [Prevotella histicola]